MFTGVEPGETGAMITVNPNWNQHMLDAFIIEKIQQERELQESGREPLRIDISREPVRESQVRKDEEDGERGIAIIDFTI